MANPLIRVEHLVKTYETGAELAVAALREINLSISPGEFVAIMGPSGSGKSTFMNILGCLDVPNKGHYYLNGEDVAHLSKDRLAQVRSQMLGFVFQGFNLLSRMDALGNVALPLVYASIGKTERNARAMVLLEQVGLGSFAHKLPNQLSGGQQQRVAIARALINRPLLILADEPTGNLDTHNSGEIMRLFRELNEHQEITLIVVTHDPNIARYAKRLVRFLDGVVVADGPVAEILEAHA
ncbi:MAG: ABC transporter ATP-binding protein [Gammaproteobacteria bacterium]|nr:ABC transporter ATP-binding protein [Gammaproteobacteria bacterium]